MVLVQSEPLPIGWKAVDFSLQDTEGQTYSLANFLDKKGLVIIFTCNHCPYAQAAWPVSIEISNQYEGDVGFMAINPNDAENYPEDSFEEMKNKKNEWNITFPYLRDENQEIAKAYKAQCTPDLYLFKNEGGEFKLYYHGRFNDNWQNPDQVTERNLENAIKDLLSDQPPPTNQPPSMGCSIKWKT